MKKFLRRKSDGKFYRGARFWRWCSNWRDAAVLDESFWETFIVHTLIEKALKDEYTFVTLEDNEENNG
jgi:hypothetical protein